MADDDDASAQTHAREEDHDHEDDSQQPARKRQRIRLSCLECRRRKLSCSRELPCDRCIKSGTPERCAYESRAGIVDRSSSSSFTPANVSVTGGQEIRSPNPIRDLSSGHTSLREVAKDHDRIRRLEIEVAQLRSALAKQVSLEGTTVADSPSTLRDAGSKESPVFAEVPKPTADGAQQQEPGDGLEYAFLRGHNFKTRYYGPHNTWASFKELTGIYPFMKETAESWLRPLNINKKDRKKRKEDREKYFLQPDLSLEALLPPKEETDSLINVYLEHFEQLHRIIHVPTFRNEYEAFWDRSRARCASFTALVLSTISVACCLDTQATSKFIGIKSGAFETAEKWIKACDSWLEKQSQKHRRLVHFQIMCMLWLSKRVNVVKKKRTWTSSGALIRDGITVGLHQDPERMAHKITPYYREMRKRIWTTMMEFDLQASSEQGVPSLLSLISNEANTPRNIDDEGFYELSTELPPSKPPSEYTFTSYQHFSRQSLHVRLEINRILTSSLGAELDWDQVTRVTDMITQEIDALPEWDLESKETECHKPLLAHTLLHLQLKQCLIPLYQPFLKLSKHNSKYQVAEFIYYNTARDIVLMHDRLFQKGLRSLYFIREDTVNAAVYLCNVTLHQPRNSTGLIISNARETLKLVEKCLAIKEDRILRCGNNDPWGYSSMCAAFGLLETHLGIKTSEAAKASSAERFIALHYKLLAYQVPPFANPQSPMNNTPQPSQESVNRAKSITPFPIDPGSLQLGASPFHTREGLPLSMPWLLPSTDQNQLLVPNPDFNLDAVGMDLNELWGMGDDAGWA